MDNEINDLGKWTWYTLMFLKYADNNSENSKKFIQDFLQNNNSPSITNFSTWNQATILVALYGLFVVPKEFLRNRLGDNDNGKINADELIFENFLFESRTRFHEDQDTKKLSKEIFLRRFRNSLSHANFEIDKKQNKFIFKNESQNGKRNFHVSNDTDGLSEFLTEMGKYFINTLSTSKK